MSKIKASRGDRIFNAVVHVIIALIVLTVVYPLVYVLSCSFSSPSMVGSGKVWLLPKGLTLIGYERVFKDSMIVRGYANTIGYTIVGTLINLIVTMPCGYALSKKTLPGRGVFMAFFMFIMYFSGGMIPTFLLVNSLRLYNTRAILVILGAFSTYNCIICRTFFLNIPKELEEAVKIDGGGHMTTFFRVMLPLALPSIGTLAIFCLQGTWEEFFSAKVILGAVANQITLPVMIQSLKGAHATRWEWIFSASILAQIPMILLFAVFQKRFVVSGLSDGSVKA